MIAFITELNDSNFDDFINNGFSLVDVWADWCQPCKNISPMIDELSVEYQGKLSVGKINVDTDTNKEVVLRLKVRNIPALIFYKDGEEIDKVVGVVTKEALVEIINQHISE